jgi:cold shock CspA family protein
MQNQLTSVRTGRVLSFSSRNGYGFLEDLETKACVFVHYTSLVRKEEGRRDLWTGEYVCFVVMPDRDGRVGARVVTGIGSGPLMCESRMRDLDLV